MDCVIVGQPEPEVIFIIIIIHIVVIIIITIISTITIINNIIIAIALYDNYIVHYECLLKSFGTINQKIVRTEKPHTDFRNSFFGGNRLFFSAYVLSSRYFASY